MTRTTIFVVLLLLIGIYYEVQSKGVHVSLTSNWESTPFLLEVAEFIATQDNDLYFQFLEKYYEDIIDEESDSFRVFETEKEEVDFIINVAKSILNTKGGEKLLDLILSTRSSSPSVILHWEHSKQFIEKNNVICPNQPFISVEWTEIQLIPESEDPSETKKYKNPVYNEIFHREIKCDMESTIELIENLYDDLESIQDLFLEDKFPNEHIKGRKCSMIKFFIYGDINTLKFKNFYTELSENLKTRSSSIMIRYVKPAIENEEKIFLQGYGAVLDLKKMEYLAIDDSSDSSQSDAVNSENSSEEFPELVSVLGLERLTKLSKAKLRTLGTKMTYLLNESDDPLGLLSNYTANFPTLARFLSRVSLPENYENNFADSKYLPRSSLYINGRYINPLTTNIYELLSVVQEELELHRRFKLMQHPDEESKNLVLFTPQDVPATRFNLYDNEGVIWVNNIETDYRYFNFPGSISEIIRPTWAGQLRFLRKNLINVLFIIDSNSVSQSKVYPLLAAYVNGAAPIRFSIMFKTEDSPKNEEDINGVGQPVSRIIPTIFRYYLNHFSQYKALNFLTQIRRLVENHGVLQGSLSDIITLDEIKSLINEDFSLLYSEAEETNRILDISNQVLRERGFYDIQTLGTLVNGIPMEYEISDPGLASTVISLSGEEYRIFQNGYYSHTVNDDTNLLEYLFNQFPSASSNIYNDLAQKYLKKVQNLEKHNNDVVFSMASPVYQSVPIAKIAYNIEVGKYSYFNSIKYANDHTERVYSITHLLILDLSTDQGILTLSNLASRYVPREGSNDIYDNDDIGDVRFAIVHNIDERKVVNFEGIPVHTVYAKLFSTAAQSLKTVKYLKFIQGIAPNFTAPKPGDPDKSVDVMKFLEKEIKPGTFSKKNFVNYFKDEGFLANIRSVDRFAVQEIFGSHIQPGKNYVFTNGRLTPIPLEYESLPINFFRSIEQEFRTKYSDLIERIKENRETLLADYDSGLIPTTVAEELLEKDRRNKIISDIIFKTISELELAQVNAPRAPLPYYLTQRGHTNEAIVNIHASLDPLSKAARRIAPMLSTLEKQFGKELLHIQTLWIPNTNITEFPLTSYYRYVLNPTLEFDESGKYSPSNSFASFTYLPTKPLLTLGLDAPTSWLVQLSRSKYDLDNIILENADSSFVFAEYTLENILVEGSCLDVTDNLDYPGGVQLQLSPYAANTDRPVDTIVMSNLGYYQLQANPGVWKLDLSGKAKEIYDLYPSLIDQYNAGDAKAIESMNIPVSSLLGYKKDLYLKKKAGLEYVSLLDVSVDYDLNSDFHSIHDILQNNTNDQMVHVFSVASGHLYERFMKIMMLSVIRTTQSKVTFWILENYISPQFKSNFIPLFTQKYGDKVRVEMVTYQWPSWLHAQTEKQRIIWAYKILFLDVLFPLDVKRIIFVDADLIVRSNLQELVDLDLQGAPYAYTPFCDNRVEMEGFRFWKTGYWFNHLYANGLKYHISALYVVDLERFRSIGAGDRLRSIYSSLSKDPGSLSNLDQDLPNYAQHSIKIYSLPQEWLWCETWCSDDTKGSAKAIDLCNNPQTKMSKLEIASRIEGWSDLDQEIKQLEISVNRISDQINTFQIASSQTTKEEWMKYTLSK